MIVIIIPCYNFVEYTKDAIASIFRNKGSHTVRLVFVDNGSTDGTAEYLETVPDSVTVTNSVNEGVGYAFNQAWNVISSIPEAEVIGFVATDCVMGPNFLDAIVESVQGDKWCCCWQAGIVTGALDDVSKFDDLCRPLLDTPWDPPHKLGWKGKRGDEGLHATWGNAVFFSRMMVQIFAPIPDGIHFAVDKWIEFVLNQNGYCLVGLCDSVFYHRYQMTVDIVEKEAVGKSVSPGHGYTYAYEHDIDVLERAKEEYLRGRMNKH